MWTISPKTTGSSLEISHRESMEASSLFIGVSSLWLLILFTRWLLSSRRKLPPGPVGFPLVGSLPRLGTKPNESLAELAKTHGPLMTVHLGFVTTVVASSAIMAKELLQKNDEAFSGRVVPNALQVLGHHESSMAWGPRWRKLRRIAVTEIFTTKRLDALEGARSKKVQQLVDHARERCQTGQPVDIGRSAFVTTLNLISNTAFSADLVDQSDSAQEFRDLIWRIMEGAGSPNLADYFPMLRPLDPQGVRRRVKGCFRKLHAIFDTMIDQRLQSIASGSPKNGDFLDGLIDSELNRQDMKALLADMFIAGTDTSSNTLEWAMTELLRNPNTMMKARAELEETIGLERSVVEESDISRLPYLQAIVKETMRLHPTVPLLLPRRAEISIEVEGFTIPKGTQVLVNAWAILRDPNTWEQPTSFSPERFLHSELDFRGRDFEFIPFGAGRRICPGLPLAFRMVHLMLASLLHSFDWKLPNGMTPKEIDMEDKFGLTLQKRVPLQAIPMISNGVLGSY